jgi:hypothetical protein
LERYPRFNIDFYTEFDCKKALFLVRVAELYPSIFNLLKQVLLSNYLLVRSGEKYRERQRETERDKVRQREAERDKERQRESKKDRERHSQT